MTRRSARRNPYLKTKHPDLFGGETRVHVPVEEGLRGLVRSDYSMEEWDELDSETQEVILGNDAEEREANIEAFVKYVNQRRAWAEEYEFSDDNIQNLFEGYFESEMDSAAAEVLRSRSNEELNELIAEFVGEGEDDSAVVAAVQETLAGETEAWEFTGDANGGYYRSGHDWATHHQGDAEDQCDGIKYNDELRKVYLPLQGDPHSLWEAFKEADLVYEREFNDREYDNIVDRIEKHGLSVTGSYDGALYADINIGYVRSRLEEQLLDEDGNIKALPAARGPEVDKVVYEFPDGSYVADVPGDKLQQENRGGPERKPRHVCVADPQYGYTRRVKEGRTNIYSLRMADGETVLTLEYEARPRPMFLQVKGDHNRYAGFGKGPVWNSKDKSEWLGKRNDEVKKVLEFIRSKGVDPEVVEDLSSTLRHIAAKALPARSNPGRFARRQPKYKCCGFCRDNPGKPKEKKVLSQTRNARRSEGRFTNMPDCPRCGVRGNMYVDLQDFEVPDDHPESRWTGEGVCRRCTVKLTKVFTRL